ncbi:hypothetical protein M1506_00240 [Patescibacteria group bacterium]|nr:hypothetical protein [Patescibacteria group bacterium]
MSIFTQIGSWIIAGAIAVSSAFGGVPVQSPANVSLGTGATNFTPVQVPRTYLYGSGIGATDTSVKLTSLKTTNGQTVGMSAFGTIGYATIDAAIPNKEENISFTGVTQNSDGTAILTGVTRGLLPVYPYTASSTYQVSHSGGASVIFSNSAPFYSQFSFWGTTTTVTGNWTFASTSIPVFDTTSSNIFTNVADIVSKAYVDSQIAAGAAPITTTTAGIGMLATIAQTASGTATSSYNGQTYNLIPQNKNFSSTGGVSQVVPVTNASGTLSSSFVGTSTTYTVGGLVSASTTLNGTTMMNGTTTNTGNIYGFINLYGTGSDGSSTISATTTLTKDVNYTNLTVATGTTLYTGGYTIYVKGTLIVNGTISNNGVNGNNGATSTSGSTPAAGGAGASSTPGITVPIGLGTNAGGPGGVSAVGSNGNNGISAYAALSSTSTSGNGGAANGNGGGTSGSAGSLLGTLIPNTLNKIFSLISPTVFSTTTDTHIMSYPSNGSAGGGAGISVGGSGCGTAGRGGGGGSAGGNGGTIVIYAKSIIIGSSGVISATGGNGGNGGNGSADTCYVAGGGGAGAGGNGGQIIIVYSTSYLNNGVFNVNGGMAGTPGAPSGAASSGGTATNGQPGFTYIYQY